MAMRRFYCSEVVDKETNKVEYHFKEAKKKKYITFKTQREAVRHVKEMKVDAMVWFRQHGQFVSSFKTLKELNYEKTDDIKIVKVKPKETKKVTKTEEVLKTPLDQADNIFLLKEEQPKPKKEVVAKPKPVEKEEVKPVVVVEEPKKETIVVKEEQSKVSKGFFETARQEDYFWIGVAILLLLTIVLVILIIFVIFLSL